MIVSFRDRETARFWSGERSRRLPPWIQSAAMRKLLWLNQAASLRELAVPRGNRLEPLVGRRLGRSSIHINDRWQSASDGAIEGRRMAKSSTAIRSKGRELLAPNPHPGEILLEELMKPLGLSQNAVARALKVSPRRINELVLGKRAVTADTDLRLGRYFNLHEGFFLGLQARYDLMEQRRKLGDRLEEITPRAA